MVELRDITPLKENVLLIVAPHSFVKMPSVVDTPLSDPTAVQPTVSAVLLLIKSVGTLEFLANNDADIEVTKSIDIIPDFSRAVSTSVADNVSVV